MQAFQTRHHTHLQLPHALPQLPLASPLCPPSAIRSFCHHSHLNTIPTTVPLGRSWGTLSSSGPSCSWGQFLFPALQLHKCCLHFHPLGSCAAVPGKEDGSGPGDSQSRTLSKPFPSVRPHTPGFRPPYLTREGKVTPECDLRWDGTSLCLLDFSIPQSLSIRRDDWEKKKKVLIEVLELMTEIPGPQRWKQ